MSDQNSKPKGELLKPSSAYEEALRYPVYRLSELMFGSLLAAYVLGFINSSASLLSSPLSDGRNAQHVAYLFVSLAYAYVTAALYLSYHSGVLTLPTMPLQRLRYDFALAITQAVAFGYSLLAPQWSACCVGLVMLCAFWRQWVEFRQLANELQKRYVPATVEDGRPEDSDSAITTQFRRGLACLLSATKLLQSWNRPGLPSTIILASLTVALGVGAGIATLRPGYWVPVLGFIPESWRVWVYAFEAVTLAALVIPKSHGILKERAAFLKLSKAAAFQPAAANVDDSDKILAQGAASQPTKANVEENEKILEMDQEFFALKEQLQSGGWSNACKRA